MSAERAALASDVAAVIRDIPDFPKPGIRFKDITPVLANAALFARITSALAAEFSDLDVTHVVGIESRGFILGASVALVLGAGFIPVRKRGKLPGRVEAVEYALEYGTDRLEMHVDAWSATEPARILIVDDVLATGGTAAATLRLCEKLGGEVVGLSFLIALDFLQGMNRMAGQRVSALVRYSE